MSRKIGRKLDTRRVRRAEDQALRGDHHRDLHGYSWNHRMDQPPLLDDTRQPKAKRKRKKVQRHPCLPGRKRHEYLQDAEVIEGWYWDGRQYKYERRYKLCVHCGYEKSLGRTWGRI